MKARTMIFISSLVLAMSVLSFTTEKREPNLSVEVFEDVKENARFKRRQDAFNSKAKGEQELAAKEAAEAKRIEEDVSFNKEGQVEVKF